MVPNDTVAAPAAPVLTATDPALSAVVPKAAPAPWAAPLTPVKEPFILSKAGFNKALLSTSFLIAFPIPSKIFPPTFWTVPQFFVTSLIPWASCGNAIVKLIVICKNLSKPSILSSFNVFQIDLKEFTADRQFVIPLAKLFILWTFFLISKSVKPKASLKDCILVSNPSIPSLPAFIKLSTISWLVFSNAGYNSFKVSNIPLNAFFWSSVGFTPCFKPFWKSSMLSINLLYSSFTSIIPCFDKSVKCFFNLSLLDIASLKAVLLAVLPKRLKASDKSAVWLSASFIFLEIASKVTPIDFISDSFTPLNKSAFLALLLLIFTSSSDLLFAFAYSVLVWAFAAVCIYFWTAAVLFFHSSSSSLIFAISSVILFAIFLCSSDITS